jgi:ParB family chromosome partitioning protein
MAGEKEISMEHKTIPVHTIQSDEHSQRIEFNEEKMQELVGSILSDGLLQPIVVKPIDGGFVVVAGHRRLEACKRVAGKKSRPSSPRATRSRCGVSPSRRISSERI